MCPFCRAAIDSGTEYFHALRQAKVGKAWARSIVAVRIVNGEETDETDIDVREAMRQFRLAAEEGDGHAQLSLGKLYYHGIPGRGHTAVSFKGKGLRLSSGFPGLC